MHHQKGQKQHKTTLCSRCGPSFIILLIETMMDALRQVSCLTRNIYFQRVQVQNRMIMIDYLTGKSSIWLNRADAFIIIRHW